MNKSQIKKELRRATIEASQIEGSFPTLNATAVEATNLTATNLTATSVEATDLTGAINSSALTPGGDNLIRFRVNGTDQAFFNENGNFVLSTAGFQPSRLCNQGAYYCMASLVRNGGFILERANDTYASTDTTRSWVWGMEDTTGSSDLVWKFNNQGPGVSSYDTYAGDVRMILTHDGHLLIPTGNLGIGTSSDPDTRVIVNGDFKLVEGKRIFLNAINSCRIEGSSAGEIKFFSGATAVGFTMVCDGSNRLGVGTITPDEKVRVNGNVKCNSLIETSDDRLKEDEKYINNALETIMKLKPQIYNKYDDFTKMGRPTKEAGLISQEVYYLAPELRHLVKLGKDKKTRKSKRTYKVGREKTDIDENGNEIVVKEAEWKTDEVDINYDETPVPAEIEISNHQIQHDLDYGNLGWSKDNPSSIAYTELIPYLIKAIQEQNQLINDLKERIQALEQ